MRTLKQSLPFLHLRYPLEHVAPLDKILFIDIETTGFTAQNSTLYLIGVSYYEDRQWCIHQWFATTYEEELDILSAFFEFASDYTHLIHFNGNNFDLPYLMQKCKQYDLPYNVNMFEGIDLYRRLSPYKSFLRLPNCKQKTMEQYLGNKREDPSGGELISVYHSYVKAPADYTLQLLITHNAKDMLGMLSIVSILAYYDLFHKPLIPRKVQANYYQNLDNSRNQELIIKLGLPSPLPVPITVTGGGCFFKGENKEATLRVPLYEEELKYFYANYKNYYYLPQEDTAIHKSVATYVDKDYRTQATPSTCYTKKTSLYLPEWEPLIEPFFKRSFESKELFFELTEEMKKDRDLFSKYASHVLQMLAVSQP